MPVEFHDYTIQVKAAIDERVNAVLEECAGELESQVKRNTRVDTGKTKNSFQHKVVDSEHTAYIGSNDENSIWEEFGTGEHALKGNGRKGAWYVPVENYHGKKKPTLNGKVIVVYGKGGKAYYKTNGKEPSRAFWKAYTSMKNKIIKRIQDSLKGL